MEYEREIFVFGSNLKGIHGAGAAFYAMARHGAVRGVGVGLTGGSYALPTVSLPGVKLKSSELEQHVEDFKTFAQAHSHWKFRLTKVGCGLAGWDENYIASLFADATGNVVLIDDEGDDVCPAFMWADNLQPQTVVRASA